MPNLQARATRQVLPFYNAMVYFVEEFVVQVLGELVHSSITPNRDGQTACGYGMCDGLG